MPREYNIRWRKADNADLSRTVKIFNAKITRLVNNGISPEILPNKISVKEIRKQIRTRREFNRNINSLMRFSRRGAEDAVPLESGHTITKWQKREISIKLSSINSARTYKRKIYSEAEALLGGKPLGVARGMMGDVRQENLLPKRLNINKIKPGEEWFRTMKNLEEQLSSYRNDKLYKDNYIKAIDGAFSNSPIPVYSRLFDVLRKHIVNMPAEQVADTYRRDEAASIRFIGSERLTEQEDLYLETLFSTWGLNFDEEFQKAMDDLISGSFSV